MKKIFYVLILMLLMSGCTNNNEIVESPMPETSIQPEPTNKTTSKPTKQPTLIPTIKPEQNANTSFDPETFELVYIEPLLNQSVGEYNLYDDYYVISDDNLVYGVINNNKELVIKPNSPFIPYVLDDCMLIFDSVDNNYEKIKNSDLNGQDGYGNRGWTVVFDIDAYAFKLSPYNTDGEDMREIKDFEASNFDPNDLISYEQISNFKTITQDGYSYQTYDASGQKGVVNGEGKMLTEALYEDVFDIAGELIPVRANGLWGYVNSQGVEVIPCVYKGTFSETSNSRYSGASKRESYYPYPVIDGRIVVKNWEDKYGVIDIWGTTLIEFEYDYGSPYYNNSIILKKDGEWIVK